MKTTIARSLVIHTKISKPTRVYVLLYQEPQEKIEELKSLDTYVESMESFEVVRCEFELNIYEEEDIASRVIRKRF
jgi:hypothetical protein